jgi:hypothetical protein
MELLLICWDYIFILFVKYNVLIGLILFVYVFIRVKYPKRSDPTMTKVKYKRRKSHHNLTRSKIFE